MTLEENKPKLKAYMFDDYDGYSHIDWFETAGKAKASFANEYDLGFCDVRVCRIPWADKYQSKGYVPPEVCLAHDWWFECCQCGLQVSSEDVGKIDGRDVYCKECCSRIKQ